MANTFELDRASKMYHDNKNVLAVMKGAEELWPNFFTLNDHTVFYTPYTSDGVDKKTGSKKEVADNTFAGSYQGRTYPNGFNVADAMSGNALTVNVWLKVNDTNWRSSTLQLMKMQFWHNACLNFYHSESSYAFTVECKHGRYYSSGNKKHRMNDGNRHMFTVVQNLDSIQFFIDGEPFRSRNYRASKSSGSFYLIEGNSPVCEFSQLFATKHQWTNSDVKRVYDTMKDYYED